MYRQSRLAMLAVTATIACTAAAQAGDIFSWNPNAVKLNGKKFSADKILLGDYSQVAMTLSNSTFSDAGYLPVESFSLDGQTVMPPGFDKSGQGWGAYVAFNSSGTEKFLPDGSLNAVYTKLEYQIFGYNGLADFGASEPLAGARNVTMLEQGSLIDGQLSLSADGVITGDVSASIDEVKPQFVVGPLSGFEFMVQHLPGRDYHFTSPTTIQVATDSGITAMLASGKGQGAQAQLVSFASAGSADPPAAVPEPASMALLGTGLLGIVALRRKRASRPG